MKNLTNILILIALSIMAIGCNLDHPKIKADLKSRFTGFEITEITPDSTNIHLASHILRTLLVNTADANLETSQVLLKMDSIKDRKQLIACYSKIDSIHNKLTASFTKFEESQFSKPDKCYLVKYLVYKEEKKIPKQEYYYINTNNGDVMHRPYDWDDFLREEGYAKLIKDAVTYTGETIAWKFKLKLD
ncbi:MAG: hypothetical protein WCK18_19540 [Prolixibacteraceae bacterium]